MANKKLIRIADDQSAAPTEAVEIGASLYAETVVVKSGANFGANLPFTFKRTLVADTDVSLDVPAGAKLAYIYHSLATPVFAKLDGEVTVPVAGAAGQVCAMFPPGSGTAYAMFNVPPTAGTTYDLHIRSASAGDVWVTFAAE